MASRSAPSSGRGRVRLGLLLLLGVVLVGTAWYWLVESFSLADALYQCVNVVSTVGFGEAEPLGARGRVFTAALIVVGVGVALYALSGLAEELLDQQLGRLGRWRVERRIDTLRDHVVLCGFGRVGRLVVPLVDDGPPVVVVDSDPERCVAAADAGLLTVRGDATEDDVLERAGIRRAATLVVSLHSDADAISTVLSARSLNPDVRIVARANSSSAEGKLRRAGVDHVVNPLRLGARRLATFALRPAVADFMDVVGPGGSVDLRIEEIVVDAESLLAGSSLSEARIPDRTGALVLAVRGPGAGFESNPRPDTLLQPPTTVIALGTGQQLMALAELLGGRGSR